MKINHTSLFSEETDVEVYSYIGLVHCSICVPKDMPIEEVERVVNILNPTGLEWGWTVSEETHFNDGYTNPCPCEHDSNKVHRLMDC